jgi:hypothetical protein
MWIDLPDDILIDDAWLIDMFTSENRSKGGKDAIHCN